MSVAFRASEARVRSLLDSIRHGRPIDNGGAWSLLDMLTLAGCLHCAILTHDPGWVARADIDALDAEKREAVEVTHEAEVVDTIRLLSQVALEALDGRFGEHLEMPHEVCGVLMHDANNKPCVQLAREGGAS